MQKRNMKKHFLEPSEIAIKIPFAVISPLKLLTYGFWVLPAA